MKEKIFYLHEKTLAVIDWANVYGWSDKQKWRVDPKKLYRYLKLYTEIQEIRFYFGVEIGNYQSEKFQKEIKGMGYVLVSKGVKRVPVILEKSYFRDLYQDILKTIATIKLLIKESREKQIRQTSVMLDDLREKIRQPIFRRKCDFDCEITLDVLRMLSSFDSLILFSGDGDYKKLVEYLLDCKKQVIVVHPFGQRGREFNELLERKANRPFFCNAEKLRKEISFS